ECGDDIAGRTLGSKQRVPDRTVEPGQPRLGHCRNSRRRRQTVLARYRKGLDIAATNLWQRRGLVGEYQVDLSGHQILHRGSAATVGHETEARAGGLLEEGAIDVLWAADAGGPGHSRVRVGLQPRDEALKVIRRQVFSADDHLHVVRHLQDGFEIIQYVVSK